MHAFQYHRPPSTKDALSLAQQKGEGRYLAGGQSLVQAMKLRLTSPSARRRAKASFSPAAKAWCRR